MATPQIPTDPTQLQIPTVEVDNTTASTSTPDKEKKRKFWPFGKKRDDKTRGKNGGLTASPARSSSPAHGASTSIPTSPARRADGSPRIASPASSQIFERNVQEESLAPTELPSTIPNHITTENHIPPALDASSMAITDEKLDPDNVEIFTHASHTPAAVAVAHGTTTAGSVSGAIPSGVMSETSISPTLPATSEDAINDRSAVQPASHLLQNLASTSSAIPSSTLDDGASSYGALDSTDVRRLSFISFADVVHAEQSQSVGVESPAHIASSTNLQPGTGTASTQPLSPALSSTSPIVSSPLRSASPARAISPMRAASPPTGLRASSPSLSASNAAGSPKIVGASPSPPSEVKGELAVETMGQALRKTGSGDLRATRDRDAMSSGGSADALGLGSH